jgi:hypothetical protein
MSVPSSNGPAKQTLGLNVQSPGESKNHNEQVADIFAPETQVHPSNRIDVQRQPDQLGFDDGDSFSAAELKAHHVKSTMQNEQRKLRSAK